MNIGIWLVRAKRWAANPPSTKMVVFIFSIIAVMIGMAAFEFYVGLPEWMSAERLRQPRPTPIN